MVSAGVLRILAPFSNLDPNAVLGVLRLLLSLGVAIPSTVVPAVGCLAVRTLPPSQPPQTPHPDHITNKQSEDPNTKSDPTAETFIVLPKEVETQLWSHPL